MLYTSFSKLTLWLVVCLIEIRKGSFQFSSSRVPSRQTDSQIQAIAKEIRSHHFDVAQDQILNLKNTSKIQEIIHAAYQYGDDADDSIIDILDFSNSLNAIDITYYVLKALRIEMAADGQRDPLKLIALAKAFVRDVQLQRNIADKVIEAETKQTVNELKNEIKIPATQILTAAILSNSYFENLKAVKIYEKILIFPHLSEEVMQAIVNRTYQLIPAIQIVEGVMGISKYIPQRTTVLLEVFKKLEEDKDLNNDAVLKIADFIRQMQDHRNYENLYPNQKYEINMMIDRLPACARNLFFTREVCIWNRGRMEYLYADNERDNNSPRDVYTCKAIDLMKGQGSWVVDKLSDDFLFKSQAFKKEYLGVRFRKFDWISRYVQTEENVRGTNLDSRWKIELDGEYCFLKNQRFNEYLFASSEMNNKSERLVFTARESADIDEIDVQWQIRDCS